MVCAAKGYPFVVLVVRRVREEKLQTMTAFGADLRIVPSDGGKVTPALFERFRTESRLAASRTRSGPISSTTPTRSTATRRSAASCSSRPAAASTSFCGAVGTGGMLRGVARALREGGSRARIVALEPAESPAMTEGRGGAHRVEGIATGSIPPHMADAPYDEARAIDEAEAPRDGAPARARRRAAGRHVERR